MNVMTCPNEGLSYLLNKYQVAVEGEARLVRDKNALTVGDQEYALLPWRSERRIIELKGLVTDGTLKDPCVLRTTLITHRDSCLKCMIKREFDIAEFLFDSKIVAVYAVMADDKLCNMVTKLECGVVVNYELAATLAEGAQIMDKHEIIASVGVALDKVVDTQINQNSIYVYGETDKVPAGYTDVDFELFGLTIDQIAKVRCAFNALKNPAALEEMTRQSERLDKLVALAFESAETGKKLIVEG